MNITSAKFLLAGLKITYDFICEPNRNAPLEVTPYYIFSVFFIYSHLLK